MINLSRRQFLRQIGIAGTGLFLTGRNALSLPDLTFRAENASDFEFLVIGDSLIWGQGLEEKDKFYTLTREWLEREVFRADRRVNLKVKAHSGSTLTFHDNEVQAFRKVNRDEKKYYHPEVNVSFPSVKTQVDIARAEYEAEKKQPEAVNLIMLSGGITDISVAGVLDPSGDNKKLESDISKYCYGSMLEVLEHAAQTFPNALIAVIGYFPIISAQTSSGRLFNALLESYSFPRPLKPIANNALTRQFFKIFSQKALKRSRIWTTLSDTKLQEAVNALNAKFEKQRAIFIKSPITEETSFETEKTLLFRMGKKGKSADPLYEERTRECNEALKELKNTTGIKYPIRFCEVAGVGHPNVAGSKAYAEAIQKSLKPIFNSNSLARAK